MWHYQNNKQLIFCTERINVISVAKSLATCLKFSKILLDDVKENMKNSDLSQERKHIHGY